MILKRLIQNPILMIGILLFSIFIMDLNRKGVFDKKNQRLKTDSCHAGIVRLKKRIPANWKLHCENTNLIIDIVSSLQGKDFTKSDNMKAAVYRTMANDLKFVANNIFSDNLERTPFIILKYTGQNFDVRAISSGENMAILGNLTNTTHIADHLKQTVQIKESFKHD